MFSGEAEDEVDGGVGFGNKLAVGVVGAVVGDGGRVGAAGVVGDVADRAEMIGQRPQGVAGGSEIGKHRIGKKFVDLVGPEITVREVGRCRAIELKQRVDAFVVSPQY